MPAASVVITVYNGEGFVAESVRSILSQSYPNFELIVVNDGSTDGTLSVLQRFEDDRLRILNPGRLGRQKALNYAINKAASPYIAILDADDVAFPDRLAAQIAFLNSNPNIGLVGSRYRVIIDGFGRSVGDEDTQACTSDSIRRILCKGGNPLFHSSVMFRKSLFDATGGYDDRLKCFEDMDFYVRLAARCALANLDQRLSYKRRHDQQYFDGVRAAHRSKQAKLARAVILYRTVKYLNASKINLVRAAWCLLAYLLLRPSAVSR